MKIFYLLSLFFLIIGWILPIHFPPWQTSYQEFITATALFLLTVPVIKNNKINISAILLFLLSTIPLIQYTQGWIKYSGDAIHSTIYIFLFFISVLSGNNLTKNKQINFQQLLSWTFITGALISLVIAVLQWLKISEGADLALFTPLENGRPYANLGQPNNLATLFGFGIAGVFYLFEKNKIQNRLALVFACLLAFGLALTQSRTPWIVAIALPLFWFWQSKHILLRTHTRHVALLTLIYFVFVATLPIFGALLDIPVSSVLEHAKQAHRWDMYKQALYFITHGPWYGFGWGQIESAHMLLANQAPPAIFYHYSHNIILDMLLWNGPWIGGIITILFTLWLVKLFLQKNSVESFFAWIGLFFLTHSMLEYPHAYLFLLLPAGLLIGIIEGEQKNIRVEFSIPNLLIPILGIAGLACTIFFWKNYSIIENDYRLANQRTEIRFIPEDMQMASRTTFFSNVQAFIYFMRLPLNNYYSPERLEWIENFTQRYPRQFSLLKASYIFALNEKPEEAISYLIKLKEIFGVSALEIGLSYLYQESENNPELLPILAHFGLKKMPQTKN